MPTFIHPATDAALDTLGKIRGTLHIPSLKALEKHVGATADLDHVYCLGSGQSIGFTPGGFHYTEPYPAGVTTVPWGKITSVNFKKTLMLSSTVTVSIPGQAPLEMNVTYSGGKGPEMAAEIQSRIV